MQTFLLISSFVSAHQAIIAAAIVGVLDLAMALMPSLSGNGVLHQILLLAKKKQIPPSA